MNHKKKGMSLMEVILALAISGILSLLMVQVMDCVNATMRATTALNRRLSYEGKFADSLIANTGSSAKAIEVRITYPGSATPITIPASSGRVTEHTLASKDGSEGANYRFFTVGRSAANQPDPPSEFYYVQLEVEALGDGQKDTLEEIQISGDALDCNYTFDTTTKLCKGTSKNTGALGASNSNSITSIPTGFAGSAPGANGTFTLQIPVSYHTWSEVNGNPDLGKGKVTVVVKMLHKVDGGTDKHYNWATMELNYCTASVYPGANGENKIQYHSGPAVYKVSRSDKQAVVTSVQ